jgi:hypothetical protein
MSKRFFIFAAVVLLVGVAVVFWLMPTSAPPSITTVHDSSSPTPQPVASVTPTQQPEAVPIEPVLPNPPVKNLPDTNQQRAYLTAFLTPISFWGKVVDQDGAPVPGATISFGANDHPNPMGGGSNHSRTSDANGLFSIAGIHGVSLFVKVSKEGYYQLSESQAGFDYVIRGNSSLPLPSASKPALFVLKKKGEAAKLAVKGFRVSIPKDGTPVEIDLETGRMVPAGKGDVRVEAWTQDQAKDAQGHYDWRCQISVPGGGVLARKDRFEFEAPAEGYNPSDEIVMTKTAERWQKDVEKDYFVKAGDNLFARLTLRFSTGGAHYVRGTVYLNPQPGSRNLEYDPAKVVKNGN